ncbi:MAG: 2-hydroxyacid dehydrogenase [Burkholderiales bacterium]
MSGPKVDIAAPVDESGATHERMKRAGINLKIPSMSWMDMANIRHRYDVQFDADTDAAACVANKTMTVTRKSLEGAPNLRLVAFYTVGFDNIDLDAATERGVLVVHSPTEPNWGGVAEGTMANILAILKKVREKDRFIKAGGWRDRSLQGQYFGPRQMDSYEGLTVGIIGLGRIGGRVADLLAPWRVKLIGYDPYVDDSLFVHHNVRRVDLDSLLKQSDIVTIHCNLTKETHKLIGAKQLAMMKKTAILANHARGNIIDIDALADALDADRIASAILDVLPEEPPPADLRFLKMGDKVLLSPHMVSNNVGTGLNMAAPWVEQAIYDVLAGKIPKHVVNPDIIPQWLARFGGKNLLAAAAA